jgi:multidrug/hemolysin transport system permease protein
MAAFILSVIFSIATVIISEAVLVISGGTLLTPLQGIKVLGLILLNSFSATSFMFFLSGFAHSSSAYSGLSTLVGTLVGFISGMYLPMGLLPETVRKVLILFPISSGSAWMREVFTENVAVKTFAGMPKHALSAYEEYTGITLKFGQTHITHRMQFFILLGSGILFIIISVFILKKKKVRDR